MDFVETTLGILTGLGLAVACGFRAFVPPLILSIAAYTGNIELGEGFQWFGELPTMIAFSVASVGEIIITLIPGIVNVVDAIEAPLVFVAGTVLSASMVSDMDPLLQWGLAAIAGGGSAELLHIETGALRVATGDNPLFSIAEDAGAVFVPILAILFPVLIIVFFLVLVVGTVFVFKKVKKVFTLFANRKAVTR